MYTVYMYIYIAKTAYQANALRDIYIYIYMSWSSNYGYTWYVQAGLG